MYTDNIYLGILKNDLAVNNYECQEAHVPGICSPRGKVPFTFQVRLSEVTALKYFLFWRSRDVPSFTTHRNKSEEV